jgi:hypothetical protein
MPGMFGQPEPLVVPAFGALRQIERIAEGQGRIAALINRRQVQDRLRWTCTRYPSNLISCNQRAPDGTLSTDVASSGSMKPGQGDLSDAEVSQSLLNMARAYRSQANVLKAKQKSGKNRRR